jgi:hypothetical protein
MGAVTSSANIEADRRKSVWAFPVNRRNVVRWRAPLQEARARPVWPCSSLYDATWSLRRVGQGPHSDRTWPGRSVRPDKCPVPRDSDPRTSCTPFGRVAPPRAVVCALLSCHGRGRVRVLRACVPESTAVRTAPARKRCGRAAGALWRRTPNLSSAPCPGRAKRHCAPRWLPRRAGAAAIAVSKGWPPVEACGRGSGTNMPFVVLIRPFDAST